MRGAIAVGLVAGLMLAGCGGARGPATTSSPAASASVAAATEAVQRYLATAVAIQTREIGSLDDFHQLIAAPNLQDPAWVAKLEADGATWKAMDDQAVHLNPPACVASSHRQWVTALHLLGQAGDDIKQTLDSSPSDPAALQPVTSQVDTAANMLQTAVALMRQAPC